MAVTINLNEYMRNATSAIRADIAYLKDKLALLEKQGATLIRMSFKLDTNSATVEDLVKEVQTLKAELKHVRAKLAKTTKKVRRNAETPE